MPKKTFILFISIIIILSITWIIMTPLLFPTAEANPSNISVHKGFKAPPFTLNTPTGDAVSLSDYEGQPVLIFLWASWCSVCKRTMPGLQSVYEEFSAQGFRILAVNTTYQDSLSEAVNYFQAQGFSFTMLLDQGGDLSREYQLHALPTAILISPEGIIQDVVIGSGMSEGYLRAILNDILIKME